MHFPSPDDHVAVGTHGRACAGRDVLCHLDQSVLVAGVRLREGPCLKQAVLDAGVSAALHAEGRSEQASLRAAACRRRTRDSENTSAVAGLPGGLLDVAVVMAADALGELVRTAPPINLRGLFFFFLPHIPKA